MSERIFCIASHDAGAPLELSHEHASNLRVGQSPPLIGCGMLFPQRLFPLLTAALASAAMAACVPAALSKVAGTNDSLSKPADTVRTGIETSEMLEATPYGVRVSWIEWSSSFRDTDLRIGDRIIGVDGTRYELSTRPTGGGQSVGEWNEAQVWKKQGARDGTSIKLTVWRRGETLEIAGTLRADRHYFTADENKPALSPGGPERIGRDGFSSAWAQWYEAQVKRAVTVLDGGWRRGTFNNRKLLKDHRAEKPRIDYLVEHYPGSFADTVAADWQRVHDVLLGPERTVTAKDLEYRDIGDKRAAQIADIAKTAHAEFVKRHKGDVIEAFPAEDPIDGDIKSVAGKLVALPEIGMRDWITEAGHGYLMAGDSGKGYYFIDSRSKAFVRVLHAQERYKQLVSPKLDEKHTIIGRIQPDPTMRIVSGRARAGLMVEPIGVMVGGAVFVDTTKIADGRSMFAGEATLSDPGDLSVPDSAPPRIVMELAIRALQLGNQAAWSKLFATWHVSLYNNGRVNYHPHYWNRIPTDDWVRARRLVLGDAFAVNVVDVGLVETILDGNEFAGAPVLEQVDVEIEHVGTFEGSYRPFADSRTNRVWLLQRLDGGPWRIITRRAI